MTTDKNPLPNSFEEYRQRMHSGTEEREVLPTPKKAVALGFALVMIVLYIGMGVALLVNAFGWNNTPTWNIIRYIVGIVLIIYGVFRAYRYYLGSDYYSRK